MDRVQEDAGVKHMKSREVRDNWREVLRHVEDGGEIIVEHYNRPVARIVPIEEPKVTTYTTYVGDENAEWITTDPEMRAMLHGEVTNLGDGRIRITADGHEILAELDESESADGQISDGMIWFEGDGYALSPAS